METLAQTSWPLVNVQSHQNLLDFLERYPELRIAEYSYELGGPDGGNASLTWTKDDEWFTITFSRSDIKEHLWLRSVYYAFSGKVTGGLVKKSFCRVGGHSRRPPNGVMWMIIKYGFSDACLKE